MSGIVLQFLLAFIVIFSCLFYGSVTVLPLTIIETIVGFMILFWFIEMAYKRCLSFVKIGYLMIPIILFVSIAIFQLLPLPINLIRIISGNTAHLYESYIPTQVLRTSFSLSICPYLTLSELFKILTCIAIFFLIINKIEIKRQFDFIINAIIIFGLSISIFGIIQKYTFPDRIYWFDSIDSAPGSFGPFVYRNNFAGYINMIIPLALGYSLTDMPLSRRVICGFCTVIMSLALFLSLSRGGILVYVAILLFMLLSSNLKDSLRTKTKTLALWFLLMVFLIFSLFIDVKLIWQRLVTLFGKDTFVVLGHGYSWWDILRIWQDFPIFGTGLGTFGSISSTYKTTLVQSLFTYAHNDYLQLLSEVGLIGFVSVALFFVLYFGKVLKTWLRRHNSYVICLVLGGISSIFGMLVYSFLDFNLHIPANALLFSIIMGLVYRLATTSFGKTG